MKCETELIRIIRDKSILKVVEFEISRSSSTALAIQLNLSHNYVGPQFPIQKSNPQNGSVMTVGLVVID